MTPLAVALTLAYVVVAALLLNLNLAAPYRAWIKVLAIVLVTGLYIVAWWGHHQLMGWATADALPENFRVHWVTVDEPDKVTGADGAIYFWVRRLDEADLPFGPPRAHQIPWDEKSAEQAQEVLEQLEEGEILNGTMSRSVLREEELDAETGEQYAGEASVAGEGGGEPMFEFFRAPPPSLPPKGS